MDKLPMFHSRHTCEFVLPEGLKELMSDLSREVLRAQPINIIDFIRDYISALLVTREHLHIASHVCSCVIGKELNEILKEAGLDEVDVERALQIVKEHLEKPKVSECKLLSEILNEMKIKEGQIEILQDAIRATHLKHKKLKDDLTTKFSASHKVDAAVQHTLDLYKQSMPSDQELSRMKIRINAAYEAYGVERDIENSNSSSSSSTTSSHSWFEEQKSSIQFSSSVVTREHLQAPDKSDSLDSANHLFYKGREISKSFSDYTFLEKKIQKADSDFNSEDGKSNAELKFVIQAEDQQKSSNESRDELPLLKERSVTFNEIPKDDETDVESEIDDDKDPKPHDYMHYDSDDPITVY